MTRPTDVLHPWADAGNYVAPAETWDGDPRLVTAGLQAFASAGLTPELPTSAELMNEYLRRMRAWINYAADEIGLSMFGNGTDGAVVIGAGTTTLTDDMHATTLVVQNTGILATNGFRVFATTSITVDVGGIISCDGATAVGGAAGAARAAGTLGSIAVGVVGGTAGNNGNPGANIATALGGAGGNGGNSSGVETGGVAGTVTRPTAVQGRYGTATVMEMVGHILQALSGWTLGGTPLNFNGGSPGGSGASDGGGSGSPGGVMLLATPAIVNNGTVRCLGGGGGAGTGAGGGGGGGGGGAALRIVRSGISGSGVWLFTGGAGGAPAGGVAGVAGTAGAVGSWVV